MNFILPSFSILVFACLRFGLDFRKKYETQYMLVLPSIRFVIFKNAKWAFHLVKIIFHFNNNQNIGMKD